VKFTIYGFGQKRAVELGLDATDLVILRWLVDFYATGKMKKLQRAEKEYVWVNYGTLCDEFPILGIRSKSGMRNRLQKLVKAGVLEFYLLKEGGTWTYYRLVPEVLEELLSRPKRADEQQAKGVARESHPGCDGSVTPGVTRDRTKHPCIRREDINTITAADAHATTATAKSSYSYTAEEQNRLLAQLAVPRILQEHYTRICRALVANRLLTPENLLTIQNELNVLAEDLAQESIDENRSVGLLIHRIKANRADIKKRDFAAEHDIQHRAQIELWHREAIQPLSAEEIEEAVKHMEWARDRLTEQIEMGTPVNLVLSRSRGQVRELELQLFAMEHGTLADEALRYARLMWYLTNPELKKLYAETFPDADTRLLEAGSYEELVAEDMPQAPEQTEGEDANAKDDS